MSDVIVEIRAFTHIRDIDYVTSRLNNNEGAINDAHQDIVRQIAAQIASMLTLQVHEERNNHDRSKWMLIEGKIKVCRSTVTDNIIIKAKGILEEKDDIKYSAKRGVGGYTVEQIIDRTGFDPRRGY